MRKLHTLAIFAFMTTMVSVVWAGPLEEALEQSFVQSCEKDKMFKGLEDIFVSAKMPFDETKACRCVSRKIVADNRVIAGLVGENKDSSYAKLAVMAYTAQCLSAIAEDGISRLPK